MILADYSMLSSRKRDGRRGFAGSRQEQLPVFRQDPIDLAPAALRLGKCLHPSLWLILSNIARCGCHQFHSRSSTVGSQIEKAAGGWLVDIK